MKLSNQCTDGTSYFMVNIDSTINDLTKALGAPQYDENTGEDKVNVEWTVELSNGALCTIYDWKEYRALGPGFKVNFHIGGIRKSDTQLAWRELSALLKTVLRK
jgi:hypothetical protein